MKRLRVFSVMLFSWFAPSLIFGADNPFPEPVAPFATATIRYAIHGVEEGRETLFIRDNGREKAIYRETTSHLLGMQVPVRTMVFKTSDAVFTYDLIMKQGKKSVNPRRYMRAEYDRLSSEDQRKVRENAGRIGPVLSEGTVGMLQQHAAKFMGYDCDKVDIPGGTSVLLLHASDIVIKSEMHLMGMRLSLVAESIDVRSVDDQVFQHPPDIVAAASRESDKIARIVARQVVATMKNPEKGLKTMMPRPAIPGEPIEISREDREMIRQVPQMMKEMQVSRPK